MNRVPSVWQYFAEICQIPRPSHHETEIQNYILDCAKRLNLPAKKDESGNIVISKTGKGNKKIILQAHLDMVAQKNENTKHDFLKDPIKTEQKGDWLYAQGTTLGADNGIGVAMILAILQENNPDYPPIEALFTASEETGMHGALGLQGGFLNGDYLINLDFEDEGEICIGCAGGLDGNFSLVLGEKSPSEDKVYKLSLTGLSGGHSGIDINKNRGNSLILLAKTLIRLEALQIADFKGGNLRNAIPREAEALFTSKLSYSEMVAILKEINDFGSQWQLEEVASEALFVPQISQDLLQIIANIPNGALGFNKNNPELVETSTNLAAAQINENKLEMRALLRSSSNQARHDLGQKIKRFLEKYQATAEFSGDYPAWEPQENSELIKIFQKTGQDIFAKTPEIKIIHAGLECGLLAQNYPHWEMLAFGPTIESPHSPDERVNVSSVARSHEWLQKSLTTLGNL